MDFRRGRSPEKITFYEISEGEIFGFETFLTGASSYGSYFVDTDKAVVHACSKSEIMNRLKEDRRLAGKLYKLAATSLALRLTELSGLDLHL